MPGSATSPSGDTVARSSGSSWLYSTHSVISRPSAACVSFAIPPMACFGRRGTAIELTARLRSTDTPRNAGRVWKPRAAGEGAE